MGGQPYLGKFSASDREFFNNRESGKSLHKDDRVEKEEKKERDPLYLRSDKDRG